MQSRGQESAAPGHGHTCSGPPSQKKKENVLDGYWRAQRIEAITSSEGKETAERRGVGGAEALPGR